MWTEISLQKTKYFSSPIFNSKMYVDIYYQKKQSLRKPLEIAF